MKSVLRKQLVTFLSACMIALGFIAMFVFVATDVWYIYAPALIVATLVQVSPLLDHWRSVFNNMLGPVDDSDTTK